MHNIWLDHRNWLKNRGYYLTRLTNKLKSKFEHIYYFLYVLDPNPAELLEVGFGQAGPNFRPFVWWTHFFSNFFYNFIPHNMAF